MIKKQKLSRKQKAMIEALTSTMGNITASAKKVGISRLTHYDWLESDPIYKTEYESLEDLEVDFYKNALDKLVAQGNVTAVIFALKCKGKKRGWVERQEVKNEISFSDTDTLNKLYEEVVNSNE